MEHPPDSPQFAEAWARLARAIDEIFASSASETSDPLFYANRLQSLEEQLRAAPAPEGMNRFLEFLQGLRQSFQAAQNRLQESENRNRLIAASAHEAIYDWNLVANRLEWSTGMQTVLGHSAETIQNDIDWWKRNLHPKDAERVVKSLEGAIERRQELWVDEYWFKRGDGSYAAILDRGIVVYDKQGRAIQMVGSMLDITEQKLREEDRARFVEQIQEQQKRLTDLVKTVPGVVWETSGTLTEGGIQVHFVSDHIEQVLGYPPSNWIREPGSWTRFVHPEDLAVLVASIEEAYRHSDSRSATVRYRHKNGGYRWLEVRACGIQDRAGSPTGVRGVSTDVTERIEAEKIRESLLEQTRQALKLRDEFIAIASHELKTPLTSLQAQSQSLLRLHQDRVLKSLPDDTLSQLLEIGNQQTQRLASLIRDLLDVSRVSVGKLQLQCRPADLSEIVRRVLDRHRPEVELSQCPVDFSTMGDASGYWDPDRLDQVITNLLSNAMKYGRGKPIRIRIDGSGSRVRLTVQDQGIGIAESEHNRIFERFERATSSRNIPGLGLGLYIAREIIGLHGGSIQVQSALNQGALFEILLPRASTA